MCACSLFLIEGCIFESGDEKTTFSLNLHLTIILLSYIGTGTRTSRSNKAPIRIFCSYNEIIIIIILGHSYLDKYALSIDWREILNTAMQYVQLLLNEQFGNCFFCSESEKLQIPTRNS